ncbi:MAG TPA: peptidoglycan DD-metalloendopeptidase family protein [Nitrospirota bacterium]
MRKVRHIATLMIMLMLCMGGSAASGGDDTTGKKELQRIKREMIEKKRQLKRADRKERSVLSELERIDRGIQSGSAELAGQQRLHRDAEAALREVELNNAGLNRQLDGLKRSYSQRVRALYKMSRSGSAAAVLTLDGSEGALKRTRYLGAIVERDRTLIRQYGSALELLAIRQAEITQKKNELLERSRAVELKKAELESQRRKKAVILADVRGQKGLYEQTLRELETSSASLWAMVRKDEQQRKAAKTPVAPSKAETVVPQSGHGRLSWPVDGPVLTRFGMQRHPEFGTMVFRRGIEIEAAEGAPVRAVQAGQAAFADWYKGYGKLVILDHGNGFYTLYGNLSQLDLAKGDRVAKGQVIGLAGETGSLKGAKLYFEIRRNGDAQDPLMWLAKR